MKAEIIPLLIVKDVAANVEYLEDALKFKLDRLSDGNEFAVMKYLGATLMLQSQRLYASSRNISPEECTLEHGIEILLRIRGVDEAYEQARKKARIIRQLHSVSENFESSIRRFSVALPDGHIITFFEYILA